MSTVDLIINHIINQTMTYKVLREFTPFSLSEIKSRIEKNEPVMSVNDLKLDELKKIREVLRRLNSLGTKVIMKDVSGEITLEVLNNMIASYEGIAEDTEELDELMLFDEEQNSIYKFIKGEIVHKFIAKVKSNCNEIKIVKIIRDFSHEPIGIIKEKMANNTSVVETEYLNLEQLKVFRKKLEDIMELGGKVQLFLDDEIVSMQFLSNVVESQEDTKNQIEQDDFYIS